MLILVLDQVHITRQLGIFLLLTLPVSASADAIVGFDCDRANDMIVLTYEAADENPDATPTKDAQRNRWSPWELVAMADDDHIGKLNYVKKRCRLSDGKYSVTIVPAPGNYNVQGRCGAWITARVTVAKGSSYIVKEYSFESDCMDTSPITTRIVIKAGSRQPEITKQAFDTFYK